MSMEHSPERSAYSVRAFCKAHSISRALFYKALKDGWGPQIMKCGSRTLVSVEAAACWRRRMETATDTDQTRSKGHDHTLRDDKSGLSDG